jgi:hypothetical protein
MQLESKFQSIEKSVQAECSSAAQLLSREATSLWHYAESHKAAKAVAATALGVAAFATFRGSDAAAETVQTIEKTCGELASKNAGEAAELLEHGAAGESVLSDLPLKVGNTELLPRMKPESARFMQGTGAGKSWTQIYTEAFPSDERDAINAVRNRIKNEGSKIYETKLPVGEGGKAMRDRTAVMTIVEPIGKGSLAGAQKEYSLMPWHAVRNGFRSQGLGGAHMEQVLSDIRSAKDTAGVALEIEHTGLKKLPSAAKIREMIKAGKVDRDLADPTVELPHDVQMMRLRRAAYWRDMGAEQADVDYKMPNLDDPKLPPLRGHLLYFKGTDTPLNNTHIRSMTSKVYLNAYGLDQSNPLIPEVLASVGKYFKS